MLLVGNAIVIGAERASAGVQLVTETSGKPALATGFRI